jgi:hypothetical protein
MDNPSNKKEIGHHIVKFFIAILLLYAIFYAFSPNKSTTAQTEYKASNSTQKASTQQNDSKQVNTSDVPPQKGSDNLKNETVKSNVIYKGKDEHGATIYSDKPITNNK